MLNCGLLDFLLSPKLLIRCCLRESKCAAQSQVKMESLSFKRTGGELMLQQGLKPKLAKKRVLPLDLCIESL